MQEPKIVGIGGLTRSGKDTLAELFIADGWFGISFGDVIRGFAKERHKNDLDSISVANMTETANWLRENRGADVVLREALKQYEKHQAVGNNVKGLVLWSVRVPVEVDFILAHGGQLIWVEAKDTVRHSRAMDDMRTGEQRKTLEEFNAQEALQWQPQPDVPKEAQMDVSYVKSNATKIIENNGNNKTEFVTQAQKIIDDLI